MEIKIGNKVVFGSHVYIISGNHQVNQVGKYIIDVQEKTEKCDEDIIIEMMFGLEPESLF